MLTALGVEDADQLVVNIGPLKRPKRQDRLVEAARTLRHD